MQGRPIVYSMKKDYIPEPEAFRDIDEAKFNLNTETINELTKIYDMNKKNIDQFIFRPQTVSNNFSNKSDSISDALRETELKISLEKENMNKGISNKFIYYNLEDINYNNEQAITSALEFLISLDQKAEKNLMKDLENMAIDIEYKPKFSKERIKKNQDMEIEKPKKKSDNVKKLSFIDDL